jgi:hypothetical protein
MSLEPITINTLTDGTTLIGIAKHIVISAEHTSDDGTPIYFVSRVVGRDRSETIWHGASRETALGVASSHGLPILEEEDLHLDALSAAAVDEAKSGDDMECYIGMVLDDPEDVISAGTQPGPARELAISTFYCARDKLMDAIREDFRKAA